MPFELLQGIGKDYAYNPMLHGFSKREIKDTIRRMEVLMKDLDHLLKRKQRERRKWEELPPIEYIGVDMRQRKIDEAYDIGCWAAMDKAGIEFELPEVERALETAPDETPPLRHEDYHKRCKHLQERRGEYWRINPTFLDRLGEDRAAGIGRRTPEKEKYWPTHQVPWKQDAPSPPPLPPSPPPPRPPSPRPWRKRPFLPPAAVTPTKQKSPPRETTPQVCPAESSPSVYQTPIGTPAGPSSTPKFTPDMSFLESGPLFTPPAGGDEAPDKDLTDLEEIVDEVDAIAVQLMRVQMLTHDSAGSPIRAAEHEAEAPCTPHRSPHGHSPHSRSPHSRSPHSRSPQRKIDSVESETFTTPQTCPAEAPCTPDRSPHSCSPHSRSPHSRSPHSRSPQREMDSFEPEVFATPQTCPIEAPSSTESSPIGLISQEELGSAESECFLTPQVSQDIQQPGQQSDSDDQSPGTLDEGRMCTEAFSPEQLSVNEMEVMMHDAVQRQHAAELVDPCQVHDEAFSPELLDDNTIESILCEPRGPTALLSPGAQQGMKLLATEARDPDTASRYGFMREEKWKERLGRWKEHEERHQEEERMRAEGAQGRQMDAASLFGVRPRGISTPPAPTTTQCHYEPETIPWGESPEDHISPPRPKMKWQRPKPPVPGKLLPRDVRRQLVYRPVRQRLEKSTKHVGKGKRLLRPKPCLLPRATLTIFPPSRILYPETKGGPTVSQPDRPSTSEVLYNTKRRTYEYFDDWAISPKNVNPTTKSYVFENCYKPRYEKMLKPGPGVVPPKPATPPPLPPPEYGPDPEHLSVYVPEDVDESPNTLKQRINEAIERFERKLETVQQRLEPRTIYREQSPWVREEYTSNSSEVRVVRAREMQREKKARDDIKRRNKWDSFMLCKYGTIPSADRYGRMRIPRTASSYRPRTIECPPKKKAPVIKPYDEPLYGPWLPWVCGSNRPPPKTAAGRISSPYTPPPKPAVRRQVETPPSGSCTAPRDTTPRAQPAQVLYGSARAPPKTCASYKYQSTPPGRGTNVVREPRRRRLVPSTPEMLYGSTRMPPRTAACPRPQEPTYPTPQAPACPSPS